MQYVCYMMAKSNLPTYGCCSMHYTQLQLLYEITTCISFSLSFSFSDATFTLANVVSVTVDIDEVELLGILLGIRDAISKFDKIRQCFTDNSEQRNALLELWYTTHPLASWSLLHQALNMKGDRKAAKAVREQFLKGQHTLN